MAGAYRLPRRVLPHHYDLLIEPDLDAGRFSGSVGIDIEVIEPTTEVVLNAAGLEIDAAGSAVHLDEEPQLATIRLPEELMAGQRHRLELSFSGSLDGALRGFYRARYEGATVALTQFEPTDARRAFPCFDEPDLKATFAVTLVVPEGLAAFSNEAPVSDEPAARGRRRIAFAPTMAMSTYLVAWVIGPFEATEPVLVDGVPVRVAALRGKLHLAGYASRAASHAMGFFARWFDLPYPAGKLDHIAVPDFAAGAMENLGCVTYRENLLLADESSASQAELQRLATVVAHETSHMWFGDLVTMKWWDGIWLNEAFATFMELTATEDFNPAWQPWTAFAAGKAAALAVDGLRSTRPVQFAVESPSEAEAMFDVLTYQKGASVLRMIEQHLGPATFRDGVASYIREHAHANTVAEDLWAALEAASGEAVGSIAASWFGQGGHPLISARLGDDGRTLSITQRRFLYRDEPITRDTAPPDAQRWAVPVSVRASVRGSIERRSVLLDEAVANVTFDGPIEWVVINDGGWGFYRCHYEGDLLERLAGAGLADTCSALERAGLVGDVWAQVVAGTAGVAEWAGVVRALGTEGDPDVWLAVASGVDFLDLVAGDVDEPGAPGANRRALQAFVREVAGPAWSELGWDPAEGEPERRRIARGRLLGLIGLAGADPEVQRECAERLSKLLGGDAGALGGDLVAPAARVHVAAGGEEAWSEVLEGYRRSTTPQDRLRFLTALASSGAPGLLERTLELALGEEVRTQDTPLVVAGVLANRLGRRLAWGWIEQHWDELNRRLPPNLMTRCIEPVTTLLEPDLAQAVHDFAATHEMPMAGPRIEQLLEQMDINVALASRLWASLASALGA
jgi:puromycin-sensitive aminopeptidase